MEDGRIAIRWMFMAFVSFTVLGAGAYAHASDNLGLGIRSVTAGKQFPAILLAPSESVKSVKIKLTDTKTQVILGVDIATEPDVDPGHS